MFSEPTPALGDVLQAIQSVQPATLGTDLSGAVERAWQVLAVLFEEGNRDAETVGLLARTHKGLGATSDKVRRTTTLSHGMSSLGVSAH